MYLAKVKYNRIKGGHKDNCILITLFVTVFIRNIKNGDKIMNLKLIIFIGILIPGGLWANGSASTAPAPVVNIIFSNESTDFESVFSLVSTGSFFGNKNAGAYYPQFIPENAQIKRDAFVFDPYAIQLGPNVYPFMFTYKGEFYYLVFLTTKILKEKTDYPFFASILKIESIPSDNRPVRIETIANIFFSSNDRLAVGFLKDHLAFVNVTDIKVARYAGKPTQKGGPQYVNPQTSPVYMPNLAKPASRPIPPLPGRQLPKLPTPTTPNKPVRKLPVPTGPAKPPIPPVRAN